MHPPIYFKTGSRVEAKINFCQNAEGYVGDISFQLSDIKKLKLIRELRSGKCKHTQFSSTKYICISSKLLELISFLGVHVEYTQNKNKNESRKNG